MKSAVMTMSNDSCYYELASNPHPEESGLHILFAGSSQTRPRHAVGTRVYDYCLLHTVLSGRGTFTCQRETYALEAGDVFVILPETLVSYESDEDDPWRYRWVAFKGSQAAAALADIGIDAASPVVHARGRKDVPLLVHAVFRAYREGGPAALWRARGCLYNLFAALCSVNREDESGLRRSPTHVGHMVNQAIRYMNTQYPEPLTIEALAESFGYSRAHFSKLFRRQTGINPVTFLLRTRLQHARLLLRERPELTVEQIASSVGFSDPLYFSKQFKRLYGTPPSAYRRSL